MCFRLEAAKDDYRIHCEDLEKQLIEVQHRNDELTSLAEESRALKDELDVLRFVIRGFIYISSYVSLDALYVVPLLCRNCSDRVVMLEASVETYKRKLENLGDLKRQMKLLEENNMTYMQSTVSLEEELRKANAARAQLETYKRQVSVAPPQGSTQASLGGWAAGGRSRRRLFPPAGRLLGDITGSEAACCNPVFKSPH